MAQMALPSIAQMKNRSTGHIRVLQKIVASERLLGVSAAPSEMRGLQTIVRTLLRWRCIEQVKTEDGWRYAVTERGHQLANIASEK